MTARPVLVIKANFLQLNIQTQICFIIAENRKASPKNLGKNGQECRSTWQRMLIRLIGLDASHVTIS